jgi:tetratricopeptide (TPR) repeat protein
MLHDFESGMCSAASCQQHSERFQQFQDMAHEIVKLMTDVLSREPHNQEAYQHLAFAYSTLGEPRKAISSFRNCILFLENGLSRQQMVECSQGAYLRDATATWNLVNPAMTSSAWHYSTLSKFLRDENQAPAAISAAKHAVALLDQPVHKSSIIQNRKRAYEGLGDSLAAAADPMAGATHDGVQLLEYASDAVSAYRNALLGVVVDVHTCEFKLGTSLMNLCHLGHVFNEVGSGSGSATNTSWKTPSANDTRDAAKEAHAIFTKLCSLTTVFSKSAYLKMAANRSLGLWYYNGWSRRAGYPNGATSTVFITKKTLHHFRLSRQAFSKAPSSQKEEKDPIDALYLTISTGQSKIPVKPGLIWGEVQADGSEPPQMQRADAQTGPPSRWCEHLELSDGTRLNIHNSTEPAHDPQYQLPMPPAVSAMFTETGGCSVSEGNAQEHKLPTYVPTYNPFPEIETRGLENAKTAAAEPDITVDLGDGIAMTQAGPPLCYASMTRSEVYHHLGTRYDYEHDLQTEVVDTMKWIRFPVIFTRKTTYSNRNEGWSVSITLDCSLCDITSDGKLLCLKALVGASKIGDLGSLALLWRAAKPAAFLENMHAELAQALDRYLPLLSSAHEYGACDVAYFSVECGEAHEIAAQQCHENSDTHGTAREQHAAVLAYKHGALAAIDVGTTVGIGVLAHTCTCLGLALKRVGEFGMAERAYLFALSEKESGIRDHVLGNMIALSEARDMKPCEQQQKDHDSIASQNQTSTRNAAKNAAGQDPMANLSTNEGKGNLVPAAATGQQHKQCTYCLDVKDKSDLKKCSRCKQVFGYRLQIDPM